MVIRSLIYKTILIATLLLALPAHAQDYTTGLVSHWTLDETSGTTANDDGSSSNDGTMGGGLDASNDSVTGPRGTALSFDGVDDVITDTSYPQISVPFTFAAWIKPNNASVTSKASVIILNSDARNFYMTWDNNFLAPETLGFITGGGSNRDVGIGTVTPGQWHHIVGVYDGVTLKAYNNGVLANSENETNIPGDSSDTLVIGDEFEGAIDDVRIYNRALSAADIEALYQNWQPGKIRYNANSRVPEYLDGNRWIQMGGQGKYVPGAVSFDGVNDWLNTTSGSWGTDSSLVTGSFWVRMPEANPTGSHTLAIDAQGRVDISRANNNDYMTFVFDNSSGTTVLDGRTGDISDGNWHHIMFSFDLSNPSATHGHIYVDGIADETYPTWSQGSTLDFTAGQARIGGPGSGDFLGDVADFWFAPGTYIDLSLAVNRTKFYDNGPVYLGENGELPTGTAPRLFLSGDTATWHTNDGVGMNGLTENGALENSPTKPGGNTGTCGGFAQLDIETGIGTVDDVWGDGQYIYAASSGGGNDMRAYTFNGTALTLQGSAYNTPNGVAHRIHGDGTYIYATSRYDGGNHYLYALSFDGSSFTNEGSIFISNTNVPLNVWSDNSYIYVPMGDGGLNAYSFNGSSFTLEGNWPGIGGHNICSVTTNNGYVFAGEGCFDGFEDVHALSFDGSSFTLLDTYDMADDADYSGLTSSGPYIFVAGFQGSNTVAALTFNGTSLNEVDTINLAGAATIGDLSASNDGRYVYVARSHSSVSPGDGFTQLAFDGSQLTKLGDYSISMDYDYPNFWADGNGYVFAAHAANGLRALSGYKDCTCANPTRTEGSIVFNTTSEVMQYCNGEDWIALGPPGDGGGGCINPAGTAGQMVYQSTRGVMQYCEGSDWIAIAPDYKAPTAGLVGHWTLDETSGTAIADSSGNGNNGTYSGAANVSTKTVAGKVDTALSFDGTDDYISMNSGDDFETLTSGTISAWVYAPDLGATLTGDMVFAPMSDGSTNRQFPFWFGCLNGKCMAGVTAVNLAETVIFDCGTPENISPGTWHHIAYTTQNNSGTFDIYIDGVRRTDVSCIAGSKTDFFVGDAMTATDTVQIGAKTDFGFTNRDYFRGQIDDVRVYNRPLDANDIYRLYRGTGGL